VPHEAAPWSGHAAAQQTRFLPQRPFVQSAPVLQPAPGPPSPTHAPLLQWFWAAQSASTVQLVPQLAPLHR
jgi:hypothetical protein